MHQEKNTKQSTGSSCEHFPSALLELVCMDYLTLKVSTGGYQHIMVITYHFTRYSMVILTRNQLARTTAEAFFNHFIVREGIPTRIHADEGANFEYE